MKSSSENDNYLICISLIYRASHIFYLVTLKWTHVVWKKDQRRPMDYFEVDVTYDTNHMHLQADMTFLCRGKFDPSVLTLESVVL